MSSVETWDGIWLMKQILVITCVLSTSVILVAHFLLSVAILKSAWIVPKIPNFCCGCSILQFVFYCIHLCKCQAPFLITNVIMKACISALLFSRGICVSVVIMVKVLLILILFDDVFSLLLKT
jgi:hypothetical protein